MPSRKKNIDLNNISAKTFFDELAEYGMLDEFVDNYLKDRVDGDEKLQDSLRTALFNSSNQFEPEVEKFLLEKLSDVLNYFLEHSDKWNKAPQ